jgi:hypothetical protein
MIGRAHLKFIKYRKASGIACRDSMEQIQDMSSPTNQPVRACATSWTTECSKDPKKPAMCMLREMNR